MVAYRASSLVLVASSLCSSLGLAASCTLSITARAGDTCALVSLSYSLTVAQFIQLNPSLTSCSLLPGVAYCVSTDPSATPIPSTTAIVPKPTTSTAPASGPASTLIPSPDGSEGICGNQYTCLGSVYGDCCSENGYCGNTTEYCGDGCNSIFGRCGGGTPAGESGAPSGTVTTVTVTVSGGQGTCAAAPTKTVTATVTVNQTVTKLQTVTQTVVSTPPPAVTKPNPILEGTVSNCKKYYQLKGVDNCNRVARSNGVTADQLYEWNPELDCDYPPTGYYICVGV